MDLPIKVRKELKKIYLDHLSIKASNSVNFLFQPKRDETASDDVTEESKHYTISHSGIDLRDTQKYIGHIHNVLKKVPSHLKIQSVSIAWYEIQDYYRCN